MKKKIFTDISKVVVLLALFVSVLAGVNAIFVKVDGAIYPSFGLKQEAITIANNTGVCSGCGDGVSQYSVSSPTKAGYAFTCNDTDGCRIYFGETGNGIKGGMLFEVSNESANNVTIMERSNIINLQNTTQVLGADDMFFVKRNAANTVWRQITAKSDD